MAPLTEAHAERLIAKFPDDEGLIRDLYEALSTGLNPHFNVLALMFALAKARSEGSCGLAGSLWGSAVRFPLSVVTPEDGTRYRTPLLQEMHASVLSLNMSAGTMARVDAALGRHGASVRMMCSCGVVMMDPHLAERFFDDPHVLAMDRYRSSLDGLGRPVVSVSDSTLIPSANMDWTDDERRFHDMLDALIEDLAMNVPFDVVRFTAERRLGLLAQQMLRQADDARSARSPVAA